MIGDLLLEVAVNRVSPHGWSAEIDEIERATRDWYIRQLPPGTEPNPSSVEHHVALRRQTTGYDIPYPYNQVVGWVRVECDGHGVVKAYAYRVSQKRVTRRFRASKATYDWVGKVIECWFHDETSETIAAKLRDELIGLTKRGRAFPGRYVDLEAFDTLAAHVDWRGLLGLS